MIPFVVPESIEEASKRRDVLLQRRRELAADLALKEVRGEITGRLLTGGEYAMWRQEKRSQLREVEDELGLLRQWIQRHDRSALDLLRRSEEVLSDLNEDGALDAHQQALLTDIMRFLAPKGRTAGDTKEGAHA